MKIKQNSSIKFLLKSHSIMKEGDFQRFITPKKCIPIRLERTKRFMRKPTELSERSSSRKSNDMSLKQIYIKTPTSSRVKEKAGEQDFFKSLASSIMRINEKNEEINPNLHYKKQNLHKLTQNCWQANPTETSQPTTPNVKSLNNRIRNLEAELDLKNHESSILSGECQRMKISLEEQKEKKHRLEQEKKELGKELKEALKNSEGLKNEIRRLQKQKQSLNKQIAFLERINYDEKTRSMQSYRETYLEEEIVKLREKIKCEQNGVLESLERELQKVREEKYNMESHYKAMKIANQCLIKQINTDNKDLHEYVLNSDEYVTLRKKYIRFLEEFKVMRNEFWNMKMEVNKNDDDVETSSLFSITASEVEKDLSFLRVNSDLEDH